MKIGIRPTEGGDLYEETLAQVKLAESLGLHSAFIGHHYGFRDYTGSPLVCLAALAAQTSTIVLGPQVLLLPYMHPMQVAEDVLALDRIASGRLVLGVGSGWTDSELETFDVPRSERFARTREGLRAMRTFWLSDGREVEFTGDFWRIAGVARVTTGVQQPHPPIWIGGHSKPSIEMAVELGDAWIPMGSSSIDELEPVYRRYDQLLRERGVDPMSVERPLARHVVIAERSQTAWDSAEQYLLAHYKQLVDSGSEEISRQYGLSLKEWTKQRYVVGDPDECIEALAEYRKLFGVNHLIIRLSARLTPQTWASQLQLFVRQVMPALVHDG